MRIIFGMRTLNFIKNMQILDKQCYKTIWPLFMCVYICMYMCVQDYVWYVFPDKMSELNCPFVNLIAHFILKLMCYFQETSM